jgi:hypothetical protein
MRKRRRRQARKRADCGRRALTGPRTPEVAVAKRVRQMRLLTCDGIRGERLGMV